MGDDGHGTRHRPRRYIVPTALVALLFAVGGVFMAWDLDHPPQTDASLNSSSLTTTTTAPPSTTSTTSTTTTIPSTTSTESSATTLPPTSTTSTPLGQPTEPIAPPQDARGYEAYQQLGMIEIPEIGLTAPLLEGIRLTTLDHGPGHWPGSAMPGRIGNVVVAGHRTSHGAEFRHLDALAPGDMVVFTTADGVSTYAVTGTEIVDPDALWITDPTPTPTATLFACHPLGSTRQRIVVHLALAP